MDDKWKIVVNSDGKTYVVIAEDTIAATELLSDKIDRNKAISFRYVERVVGTQPNKILSEA